MRKFTVILIIFFCILFTGWAETINVQDSLTTIREITEPSIFEKRDSSEFLSLPVSANITSQVANKDTVADILFKPDPMRSVWMGALVPGFGQIANKKYWKLPIVYGGFMGFAYAINYNQSRYMAFKTGYIDISDNDPNTNYHLKLLPRGYTLETFPGGEATFKNRLKSGMDQFHRYRDLSLILTIGYYALVMLDAFVDAQLYDFDVKPDLAIQVMPTTIELSPNEKSVLGLQCSIRF